MSETDKSNDAVLSQKIAQFHMELESFRPAAQMFDVPKSQLLHIDLSHTNEGLNALDVFDMKSAHQYIFNKIADDGKTGAIGGYGEIRRWYQRNSDHFGTEEEPRNIHIGVDVWLEAGSAVYAPLDGRIHSFANNEGTANYGPTIIIEHQLGKISFFMLIGHLSTNSLINLKEGQQVSAGDMIARLGHDHENGGWPPHVHVQCIADIQDWKGDFPGVCKGSEQNHYLKLCPDPSILIL